MELDTNVIALQSVLNDITKNRGEYFNVICRDGNEKKIQLTLQAIKDYLENITFNLNNEKYSVKIQEALCFLMVNTNFIDNDLLCLKEYFHLINIIPILSRFMLANIIIELNVVRHYCSMMSSIPFNLNHQLLPEIMTVIKQCDPEKKLSDTYVLLESIITLLPKLDSTDISKLNCIFNEMLKNLCYNNPELIENWKLSKIQEQIGHTFLCLLKLLEICTLDSVILEDVTNSIIRCSVDIMKTITVDVFLEWAEINHESGQPLQMVIANEAFLVIQHLNTYEAGKTLSKMLSSIAIKPKSIEEIILQADISTIILNINKCDCNQKLWFNALINNNVFQNVESVNCLKKWLHLCTKDNVIRLFHLYTLEKKMESEPLLIDCAKSLNLEDLTDVVANYFYNGTINNFNSESVKEELILLLNKIKSNDVNNEDLKTIYLLLLQNPELVLRTIYTNCLNKRGNTGQFKPIFEHIKNIINVQDFAKITFINVIKNNLPTTETLLCHKELLEMLLEYFFEDKMIISEIFVPQLEDSLKTQDSETLLCLLQICNLLPIKYKLNEETLTLVAVLSKIMETSRCNFFKFSNINLQITQEAVKLMSLHFLGTLYPQFKLTLEKLVLKDPLNKFYVLSLYDDVSFQILQYVCPTLDSHPYIERVVKLLQVLPSCVPSEWILITKELEAQYGFKQVLKLYQDIIFLLCQLIGTQEQYEGKKKGVANGLIYCLHQYANIVKEILLPNHSLDEQKLVTKSVCYLIKVIPQSIKKEEGSLLAKTLPYEILVTLKEDREFILSLVDIEEVSISKMLAKLVLS